MDNLSPIEGSGVTPGSADSPYTFPAGAPDFSDTLDDAAPAPSSSSPQAGQHASGSALQQAGQFAKGTGEGLWDGITGAVKGVGHLATGAYHFATDPNARRQDLDAAAGAAQSAGHAIVHAVQHPAEAAHQVAGAAVGAARHVSQAYEAAAAEGNGAEFLGNALGEGIATVGADLVPGGAEAEAAGALGDLGRAGEAVNDAGHLGEAAAGTSRAAEAARAASRAPDVSSADVAAFRERIHVPDTKTVAVGRTNVPGLENEVFEGASPKVRREGGLPPQAQGPIRSSNPNPIASNHAEQDIANQFVASVDRAGLHPSDLDGKTLTIRVDNDTGVCDTCRRGLENPATRSGVIKQLSEKYPGLTIHVIVDNPGPGLRGPADFKVLNGAYVP